MLAYTSAYTAVVETPLASPGEAAEIARRVGELIAPLETIQREAEGATKLLARIDAAILDKAFTGQLVPQDPNDEPASVLLERIMAARTATPVTRRGRKAKGRRMEHTWPAEPYVCLMADYGSEGVWDRRVVAGTVDELPLSPLLRDEIRAWAEWYNRDYHGPDDAPDPDPFPRAEFAAQGLALTRWIKAELSDWTIVYVDVVSATGPERRDKTVITREITL